MENKGVSPKSAQKEKGKKKDLGLKSLAWLIPERHF